MQLGKKKPGVRCLLINAAIGCKVLEKMCIRSVLVPLQIYLKR